MKRSIFFLLIVVLIVAGAFALSSFMQSNFQPIRLKFLGFQTKEVSLAVLVLISFVSGIALTAFFILSSAFSKHLEARRLRRENKALEKLLEKKEAAQRALQEQLESAASTPAHQKQ